MGTFTLSSLSPFLLYHQDQASIKLCIFGEGPQSQSEIHPTSQGCFRARCSALPNHSHFAFLMHLFDDDDDDVRKNSYESYDRGHVHKMSELGGGAQEAWRIKVPKMSSQDF